MDCLRPRPDPFSGNSYFPGPHLISRSVGHFLDPRRSNEGAKHARARRRRLDAAGAESDVREVWWVRLFRRAVWATLFFLALTVIGLLINQIEALS